MRVLQVQGPVQLHPHHGGHAAHGEVRGLLCQARAEPRDTSQENQVTPVLSTEKFSLKSF